MHNTLSTELLPLGPKTPLPVLPKNPLPSSPRTRAAAKTGQYQELSELTNLKTLITTLAGHIAAEAARR